MDEGILWTVAIGSGVSGLLLLAIASVVLVYWNTVSRRPRPQASANGAQARSEGGQETAEVPTAQLPSGATPWLWIKAWIFAVLHAGTVGMVLGGLTFFEDLVRAGDEMQHTGNVTFPRQLLPGTLLSQQADPKRLSHSSGGGSAGVERVQHPAASSPEPVEWEVVEAADVE